MSSVATAEAFSPPPLTSSGDSMTSPVNRTGPLSAHGVCAYVSECPNITTTHTRPLASAASDHVQSTPGTHSAPVSVQQATFLEGVCSGVPQMSAVLPRGFRRSKGTSRLSTGVTPRPFGSRMSRTSTLTMFYSVSTVFSATYLGIISSLCLVLFLRGA